MVFSQLSPQKWNLSRILEVFFFRLLMVEQTLSHTWLCGNKLAGMPWHTYLHVCEYADIDGYAGLYLTANLTAYMCVCKVETVDDFSGYMYIYIHMYPYIFIIYTYIHTSIHYHPKKQIYLRDICIYIWTVMLCFFFASK